MAILCYRYRLCISAVNSFKLSTLVQRICDILPIQYSHICCLQISLWDAKNFLINPIYRWEVLFRNKGGWAVYTSVLTGQMAPCSQWYIIYKCTGTRQNHTHQWVYHLKGFKLEMYYFCNLVTNYWLSLVLYYYS